MYFRYRYQDKFFNNVWEARKFEKDNNVFVSFETDIDEYRKKLTDTTLDLTHNYDLDYLKLLRQTKEYIRLFYSGGFDSDQILQLAVDNNIFIDEVVVVTRNLYNKPTLPPCDIEISNVALPALGKLNSSQIGSIVIKNYDADYMRNLYADPAWMFKMQGGDIGFRCMQFNGYETGEQTLSDCQIAGLEKPSLLFYKNKWYATIVDNRMASRMFLSNPCLFYMMPDNIKSFLSSAIKYRNKIKQEGKILGKSFEYFSNTDTTSLGKYPKDNFLNAKDRLALAETVENEDFDLLSKWHKSLEFLSSVFPELKNNNSIYRMLPGKFLWFIDIDSFEIFSQDELIPNGFD